MGRRARLLDATERGVERGADGRPVDPHHARLDLGGEVLGGGQRTGADRRRQPVVDGVGAAIASSSEPTRSKPMTGPNTSSRAIAVPAVTSASTVGGKNQPAASSPSVSGCRRRRRRLRRRAPSATAASIASTARSSISGPIVTPSRSPGPTTWRPARATTASTSSVVHRLLDEDAAGAGAGLAAERERRAGDHVGGGVEVGVGEHDDRVLAAELELQALAEPGRVVDLAADGGRAGERHGGDVAVGDEVGAGGEAVHDVEHPRWQAGVDERLRRADRPSAASSARA